MMQCPLVLIGLNCVGAMAFLALAFWNTVRRSSLEGIGEEWERRRGQRSGDERRVGRRKRREEEMKYYCRVGKKRWDIVLHSVFISFLYFTSLLISFLILFCYLISCLLYIIFDLPTIYDGTPAPLYVHEAIRIFPHSAFIMLFLGIGWHQVTDWCRVCVWECVR